MTKIFSPYPSVCISFLGGILVISGRFGDFNTLKIPPNERYLFKNARLDSQSKAINPVR